MNRGLDHINLDDILVDLKLSPEVLEVPVPKYFIEDRAKELDDRDKWVLTQTLLHVACCCDRYMLSRCKSCPVHVGHALPFIRELPGISQSPVAQVPAHCIAFSVRR